MEGLREAVETLPSRESLALKKAIQLYESRKLPKALKSAEKVLESSPAHAEGLCIKAVILQAMGNLEEALAVSKSALSRNLGKAVCWHTQGLLKQAEHQNKEALKLLTQAYSLSPDNAILQRDLSLLQLQLRQYEAFRQIRLKSLLARSSTGVNWVAYAVAEYLCGHYEKAVEVLDSLLKSLSSQLSPVEVSEIVMFKGHVLDKSGKTQETVSFLAERERLILDKVALKETQTRLYIRLEQYANAAEAIYSLLEINPESQEYHNMLQTVSQASGIPPADVYSELADKYPKANLVQRIPLDFTPAVSLAVILVPYIAVRLRKGIPSLATDLKSLYKDEEKARVVAEVIGGMVALMESERRLIAGEKEQEPPSTMLWLLYLQAAHYKVTGDLASALATIDKAILHTPTVPDLYILKGRILKHLGQLPEAAASIEEARLLDLADRYLNNTAARYFLRANNIEKAEKLLAMFSREQGVMNVHEMQNMWFELEAAEAHYRLEHWQQAAEEFTFVDKQFGEIYEDQSDFHMYCFRRMTLLSYVKMLDFEDNLFKQGRYCRAVTGLLHCYLADPSTVTIEKACQLSLQLLKYHSSNVQAIDLCLQVFISAGKLLLVLKCLFKLKALGADSYARFSEMLTKTGDCPAFDVANMPPNVKQAWQSLVSQLSN